MAALPHPDVQAKPFEGRVGREGRRYSRAWKGGERPGRGTGRRRTPRFPVSDARETGSLRTVTELTVPTSQ